MTQILANGLHGLVAKGSKACSAALTTAILFTVTPSALALFDAELLVGKRWYDVESKAANAKPKGVAAQEVYIGAHLDPIPLVPVAFGASVSIIDLDKDDFGSGTSEAKVLEPALDIKAWIPMVPIVTPYVKVRIPVMGKLAVKQTDNSTGTAVETVATYSLSGYHLNVGVKYSPLPLIKILLETGMGMESAKVDEIKVGGTKVNTGSDADINSKGLLLGIEVGI